MIPACGPQTRVGAIIDDADDGVGDGDGDDIRNLTYKVARYMPAGVLGAS